MRHALKIHPDSRCAATLRLEVLVARPQPESLDIRYIVTGDIGALRMPPATTATRVDGLWRHISGLVSTIQAGECSNYLPTLDTLQSNCETL